MSMRVNASQDVQSEVNDADGDKSDVNALNVTSVLLNTAQRGSMSPEVLAVIETNPELPPRPELR